MQWKPKKKWLLYCDSLRYCSVWVSHRGLYIKLKLKRLLKVESLVNTNSAKCYHSFCFFFFFFFFGLLRPKPWHMEVPRWGVESELLCGPVPQPWQQGIQATSASSWMLVRFTSTVPWRELHILLLSMFDLHSSKCTYSPWVNIWSAALEGFWELPPRD